MSWLTWATNKLVQLFRRFNVFVTAEGGKLRAGESTRLCTIRVDLGNGEWDGIQERLPFVSHKFDNIAALVKDEVDIQPWKILNSSGQPEKAVYVTATKAGENRKIQFFFRENNVTLVGYSGDGLWYSTNDRLAFSCLYSVVPSSPANVVIKTISGDYGDKSTIYRGGTAAISVETYDAFGNSTRDNNPFNGFELFSVVPPNSVQLLKGEAYSFKLKCLETGRVQAWIECRLGQDRRRYQLDVSFEVKQPPASAEYSSVITDDRDLDLKGITNKTFEAGTAVKFKVHVRDIYGNPLRQKERKVEIEVALNKTDGYNMCLNRYQNHARKTTSITGEDSSDLYNVNLILQKSGNWELIVSVDGNKLLSENLPISFTVVPLNLSRVHGEIQSGRYRIPINMPQTLIVKALDKFDNIIPFKDNSCQFNFYSNIRSLSKNTNLELEAVDGSASCGVTFVSVGQHCVKLLLRDGTSGETVADSVIVNVSTCNYDLDGYDDTSQCELVYYSDSISNKYALITCKEVSKGELIGPDHSRLYNINRVLGEEILTDDRLEEEDNFGGTVTRIKNLSDEHATKIHGLIVAYLRGRYFRQKANTFAELRDEWKVKSEEAYEEKNFYEARKCNRTKEKYRECMTVCNKMARDEIFDMYNEGRELEEIDLHELYVANETKLEEFYHRLVERRNKREATQIVNKTRAEQDEAIEKLRERLQMIDVATEKPQWLEVIVGAGHHSRGKQKIKPKVQDFLKKERTMRNLPAIEPVNEGSLLMTFGPYSGPEPCTGFYYCKTCKKSWCSQNSWVGKYQCCYRCHRNNRISKCYPMKQSAVRREGKRRKLPGSSQSADHHYQELCQKCQELGRNCISAN